MSIIMQGIFGCFIGCGILIIFHVALYRYQGAQFKKEMAQKSSKDFVAMRLYKEHLNTERERQLNKPDHLLGIMQDFFVELRERDKNNDKTS